jgi:hypothetical protein
MLRLAASEVVVKADLPRIDQREQEAAYGHQQADQRDLAHVREHGSAPLIVESEHYLPAASRALSIDVIHRTFGRSRAGRDRFPAKSLDKGE